LSSAGARLPAQHRTAPAVPGFDHHIVRGADCALRSDTQHAIHTVAVGDPDATFQHREHPDATG
jgi:hypothetical protein